MGAQAQAVTILAGIAGGVLGHFAGRRELVWTAVGALAGAIVVPPLVDAAIAQAALPPSPSTTYTIQLVPGATRILRASVGDRMVITAPSGWGVPSATANIPGFLEIESTDTVSESTTLRVIEAGQGQLQMSLGGEVAILSVEAS